MSRYRVVFEDPEKPEDPVGVLIPTDDWLSQARAGNLPPISVYWELMDDEEKAAKEGSIDTFSHDPDKYELQFTAPRVGPLTEEQAMEYLVMKCLPRHIWSVIYNRPMFKIVRTDCVPSNRQFRDAWRLSA
jgi:hypothetical protein|tara:strand:- start:780 stop:1172 length:393 start_codon:yes stop_codon:yes gene_type:complete